MIEAHLFVAILVFGIGLILTSKDSFFSPSKFALVLNTLYVLLPAVLTGYLGLFYENFASVFPSLYDRDAFLMMVKLYIILQVAAVVAVFLAKLNIIDKRIFRDFSFKKDSDRDIRYAYASIAFFLAGVFFVCLAIAKVGFSAYSSYSVDPTIGGDRIAHSFKAQAHILFSFFSFPFVKWNLDKKRYKNVVAYYFILIFLSFIGGSRKILIAPFLMLVALILQNTSTKDGKTGLVEQTKEYLGSKRRNFSKYRRLFILGTVFFVLIALVRVYRESRSFNFSFELLTLTVTNQFVFSYLIPCSFVDLNFESIRLVGDSFPVEFIRLLLNPVLYTVPRFIMPNKDQLVFDFSDRYNYDFNTVGGTSFIHYFLGDSVLTLFLASVLIYTIMNILYVLSQRSSSNLLSYMYVGCLVQMSFLFNRGFIVSVKIMILQICISYVVFDLFSKMIILKKRAVPVSS